jgi:PAS domain S-box-containing protein
MRVVIAEDNEDSRALLQAILEGQGHEVRSAANGELALELVRQAPPDLVVSDILMPVSDGYSLCRAVKSDPALRRIPFIFYTATYTEPSDRKYALDMGADQFLIKPMEPDLLLAEIEAVLARSAAAPAAGPLPDEDAQLASSEKHVSILVNKLSKKVEELDRERRRLQESEAKYRAYVDNSPLAIFMIAPGGGILEANPTAAALAGCPAEKLQGKNLADLLLPASRSQCLAGLDELRASGRARFEATCARKDGQEAAIVMEAAAVSANAIVFCTDLTLMKRAEAELARSAAEKEAMRKEIHHRVKNNLQVICSLLRIQSSHIEDPVLRDIFSESESRIHAMALVHNELYACDELACISMQQFMESLALRLAAKHHPQAAVTVDAGDVTVSIAASIPCGLLLNELLLNCLKHAYAPGAKGGIRVSMQREGKRITLQVADNGKGLPPGFDPATAQTMGMTLIMTLVQQLKGSLRLDTHGGTSAVFEFEEG